MDYEAYIVPSVKLCEKLKEAGFPQDTKLIWALPKSGAGLEYRIGQNFGDDNTGEWVPAPFTSTLFMLVQHIQNYSNNPQLKEEIDFIVKYSKGSMTDRLAKAVIAILQEYKELPINNINNVLTYEN